MFKMQKKIFPYFLAISFFFLIALDSSAQKVDTIYHTNGNILTGDLVKLNYGVVTWKMEGMGTITYETPEVKNIISRKQFEVKLTDGTLYFGSFDTTSVDRKVKLVMSVENILLDLNDIVEVYPIKRSFWLRTSGDFSLGFNYSKGSDVATLAISGNLSYRKRNSVFSIQWDNNNTFQADTLSSTNINAGIGAQRVLKKSWSIGTILGASQNSQLDVKLRLNLAAYGIRDIVYNKWNRYWVGAGLSVQRETPYSDSPTYSDMAGLFTTAWKVYKYTEPKVWVDADLSFLPYITGDWRYRVNFNLNPKVGIFSNNFQIGLKFYYTYDSNPSVNATSSFDWGINFELSYDLH